MESTKFSALFLICMIFISSADPILGCGACGKPPPKHGNPKGKSPKGPIPIPPIVGPPINLPPVVPPIVKPPVVLPPVTVPPIVKPPIDLPPVTVPPIVKPPFDLPPVTVVPPITTKPPSGKPCPSPPAAATCPIDTLKLGACVDLLGLVHIGLGDPVVNTCCPVLAGLVELEAAVCLCTTLKLRVLNLNIYAPLALQLLVTCGKTPPPGYTCSL